MRKAIKLDDSQVIAMQLTYLAGKSAKNKKLATILLSEQKGFCAYTDEFITRTDAYDIDHFNPTLKGTAGDSYNNWFIVKHQWNNEKNAKWERYTPVLHPTADDFEKRIIYLDGDYVPAESTDFPAINLISLLKLDDPILAINRKKYIRRKRIEIEALQQDALSFFLSLFEADPCRISYLRAIKEEFGVDLWEQIPAL